MSSSITMSTPSVEPDADVAPELGWHPGWTGHRTASTAVRLSAGTDLQVDLDGLSPADADALVALAAGEGARPSPAIVARLVELGALSTSAVARAGAASVVVADPGARPLAAALQRTLGGAPHGTDVDVVLRCGPGSEAPRADRERLIVDVGLHHTFVVGPFVVPGRSACEVCLDTRVARRWPTVDQPVRPLVVEHADLVAHSIARHVQLIAEGRSPVVNATIATDLDTMVARRDPLLMSPGCPTCGLAPPDPRPHVPWEVA